MRGGEKSGKKLGGISPVRHKSGCNGSYINHWSSNKPNETLPVRLKPGVKLERACLITLHSNFETFQKGHPAVEFMLDGRIFER